MTQTHIVVGACTVGVGVDCVAIARRGGWGRSGGWRRGRARCWGWCRATRAAHAGAVGFDTRHLAGANAPCSAGRVRVRARCTCRQYSAQSTCWAYNQLYTCSHGHRCCVARICSWDTKPHPILYTVCAPVLYTTLRPGPFAKQRSGNWAMCTTSRGRSVCAFSAASHAVRRVCSCVVHGTVTRIIAQENGNWA